MQFDGRGTQRIYVARLGPFGFAMVALVAALLAALVLFVVLGAFVILIPLAGVAAGDRHRRHPAASDFAQR